jgi:hypothetical protein
LGVHPERAALPLHLRAGAAALFDRLPAPDRQAADRAAEAVERFRAQLAERLPRGSEVTVDAYRARQAASCPASALGSDDEFSWTAATAARHLGLRAVAIHLCGEGRQPLEQAVRSVLVEHIENGGERSPGPWLAQLDDAGMAVAEAQARRWAEQAVGWLPLRLVGAGALRFLDDHWWPGGARGGRTLVIHGRSDLTVELGGSRVAVTFAGGTPRTAGLADADALNALATVLCDPRARLVRVVRVHPASGDVVATDVTPALLHRGVDVVAATATAIAGTAEATPGPACTWCDRRQVCEPGTTWLQRPDRRSMGLPLPRPPGAQAT